MKNPLLFSCAFLLAVIARAAETQAPTNPPPPTVTLEGVKLAEKAART